MKLKRLASPKWWPIERKEKKFVFAPRGGHAKAVPLTVVIRDILKLTENAKEARGVIKGGKILVDGKPRKDPNFGIGLMDLIEVPSLSKTWRAVPRNGLTFIETSGEDGKIKICKILDKKILRGKKTQLNLDGGKNLLTDKEFSTKDSLLIKMPEQEIIKHLKFEKGNLVLIRGGKQSGGLGVIKEIDKKNKRVWLEDGTEVLIKHVMVVGKDKPLVKIK